MKLTVRTLQAANDHNTSEQYHDAAVKRVSKLVKQPKMDSVLSYNSSMERKGWATRALLTIT